MSDKSDPLAGETALREEELHLEEVFTDLQSGTLKRLSPVRPDGTPDPGRPVRFTGHTQVYTPAGILPLDFELDARTLPEAIAAFPAAVRAALAQLAREMEALQRDRASRIVAPGQDAGSNLILP